LRALLSFIGTPLASPSVVFFCHTFCKATAQWHIAILIPLRSIAVAKSHATAQCKKPLHGIYPDFISGTTTTVPLVPEKNNPKLY
jgi:hypothetical protein